MATTDWMFSRERLGSTTAEPGRGAIALRQQRGKTRFETLYATSPLRFLTPRNHGSAVWVFAVNLGGGLLDGDRIDITIDAHEGTSGFFGTQGSTRVHPSHRGCSQRIEARIASDASLALVPDPSVCFAGARYRQETRVLLAEGGSVVVFDAYTCGRAARGERWQFARLETRTSILRERGPNVVDATTLDPAHGSVATRMGRFDVVSSLLAIGPCYASVCDAMLDSCGAPVSGAPAFAAVSPIGSDGAVLRIAADCFETASRLLRPSFAALAAVLNDDPFARKW